MLQITPYESRGKYYYLVRDYENDYIKIGSSGFFFDGLTIPRLFWSIVGTPCDPRTIEAGLTHDYLYLWKHNRKEADKIFYKLLLKNGVNKIRAVTLYLGVRLICGIRYRMIPEKENKPDYFKETK